MSETLMMALVGTFIATGSFTLAWMLGNLRAGLRAVVLIALITLGSIAFFVWLDPSPMIRNIARLFFLALAIYGLWRAGGPRKMLADAIHKSASKTP